MMWLHDMDKSTIIVLVSICLVFLLGFGWGQWFAERSIRKEKTDSEQGRLVVSVPMHGDDASQVFEAISIMAKKAREDRHD